MTLSLMILLVVVAVGLLSLSSVSLRSSNSSSAESVAKANARLALMLALGELQASLGTDTSVSAPASSVVSNAGKPHLTGAWQRPQESSRWDQWHWAPKPDGSPSYKGKADLFKGWLVSTSDPAAALQVNYARSGDLASFVSLVGNAKENLKNNNVSIAVASEKVKVSVGSKVGKFAWAAFDESTKAPVNLGNPSQQLTGALEMATRTAPGRVRADILDETLKQSLEAPRNLISLDTGIIPGGSESREGFLKRFHDFTSGSVGLLTDPANGGLKKDLTSLLEPASIPADAFPTNSPYPDSFGSGNGEPSWAYLQNHYRKYKNVTVSGGSPTYNLNSSQAKNTDLKVDPSSKGLAPIPKTERLLPVIAKFQLVFSMVAHYAFNVETRRQDLNSKGDPLGFTNYGSPHLVYDPVITLYNPYDVTLNLTKTRIRIWDPPVGLRFTKIDNKAGTKTFFRAGGEFLGLGRFQITSETDASVRKCFTMVLADGTSQQLSTQLLLRPGEVRVFSPRVESSWTWGAETAGGFGNRTNAVFFDFDQSSNFGNVDHRSNTRYGQFGVECAPGWDVRAGLQVDHLSGITREAGTRYAFEGGTTAGWMNVRNTDAVKVEIKPLVTGNSNINFQVDMLAGVTPGNVTVAQLKGDTGNQALLADTLRSYKFYFTGRDPSEEISADPTRPIIDRTFLVGDILQRDDDQTKGGKKPFAMLEMSARTTKDQLTDSKPWLYNNLVVEGGEQRTAEIGLTHQSYDLRLIEMNSFDNFPDGISIDPDSKRGYFGATASSDEGSSFVNMLHVPQAPAASLGDLISSNLASSSVHPRVVHPFGNSRAHPLIPVGGVSRSLGGRLVDHSYLLNDSLWDGYFFSSLTSYTTATAGDSRSIDDVIAGVFEGTRPALNSRLMPIVGGDPEETAKEVTDLGDLERGRQLAKYVGINGPFNVNSTSLDAWRAVLSSLRDRAIQGVQLDASGQSIGEQTYSNPGETPYVRAGKPMGGPNAPDVMRWAAFRTLTDGQIENLAKLIIAEITARGGEDNAPSFTLGEFVNRRPGGTRDLHSMAGLLQTALDKSDINRDAIRDDAKSLNSSSIAAIRKTGALNEEVMSGNSSEGCPTMITQGDLMAGLSSVATVRGDTFKLRAYGESTAADGSTVARAWCEAVVQRVPDFVDPADAPETAIASLTSSANKIFGRRFEVVSFRWLGEQEL